jgi:parallel beta-helix repeat protein
MKFENSRASGAVTDKADSVHPPAGATRHRLLPAILLFGSLLGGFSFAASANAATRYVDPANPASQDQGAGDAAHPYKTLHYAGNQVQPGDTLIIAAGTYRDTLALRSGLSWSASTPTTIETAPNASVIIKGSDRISGWTSLGGGKWVKSGWTTNSQQVFVNGSSLQQIGGQIWDGYPSDPNHPLHNISHEFWPTRVSGNETSLPENSFYYKQSTQQLFVRVPSSMDLNKQTVEVSTRTHWLVGNGVSGLVLRGIHFAHANMSGNLAWGQRNGSVRLSGNHILVEDIDIANADAIGLKIVGNDNTVRGSTVSHSGQLGVASNGYRNRFLDNEITYNNDRGFWKYWASGGFKFVGNGGLKDSEVAGNRVLFNLGDGIWFDWKNQNNRIHDNISAYNTGFGIHYEVSERGYIYDNYVFANGQRGIYLAESFDSLVMHNLVAFNALAGITVIDQGGRGGQSPTNNQIIGNIVAWNTEGELILPNGIMGNRSDYDLYVTSGRQPKFSVGWGHWTSGLDSWRQAANEDLSSWGRTPAASQTLTQAVSAKRLAVDWSELRTLASQFAVQWQKTGSAEMNAIADGTPPGPRQTMAALLGTDTSNTDSTPMPSVPTGLQLQIGDSGT